MVISFSRFLSPAHPCLRFANRRHPMLARFSRRGLVATSLFSPEKDPERFVQSSRSWAGFPDLANEPLTETSGEKLQSRISSALRKEPPPADFSDLGIDITVTIARFAWLHDRRAPLHASVCRTWAMAAPMVKQDLRCTEVAPLRPTIKGSLEPALEPTGVDAKLALIISEWERSADGKVLHGYVPFSVRTSVRKTNIEHSDMISLLDARGWLTNFVVDSYLSTLMPELTAELAHNTKRAFVPGWYSTCWPNALADIIAVTTNVNEIFAVFNLHNSHWALMRLQRKWERLEIFDGKGMLTEEHGWLLLIAAGLAPQVCVPLPATRHQCARIAPHGDLSQAQVLFPSLLQKHKGTWQVVAYGKNSGMPQQMDGCACGIFTCVIAKHLVEDRTLPVIPPGAELWRQWIAAAILQERSRLHD